VVVVVVVVVNCLEACNGIPAGKEAGTTSNAVVEADKVGAFSLADHAICNNHSPSPTTSHRLVESKPIDNKRTTIALHRPRSA
jgi:hypothetical protein